MKKLLFALFLLTAMCGCVPAYSQGVQNDAFDKAATGTNTYAVTINAITAAAPYDGQKIWLRFANANTGASTISITIAGGTVYTTRAITLNGSALVANDIVANQYVGLVYYLAGTSWQLQRAGGQVTTQTVTITAGTGISVAGSVNTFTITNTSPATDAWSLLGNAGTVAGTNFQGTTDSIDAVYKTNNIERVRIIANGGRVGMGTSTPQSSLDVTKNSTSILATVAPVVGVNNTNPTLGNGTSTWNISAFRATAGNGAVVGSVAAAYNNGGGYLSALGIQTATKHPITFITNLNATPAEVWHMKMNALDAFTGIGAYVETDSAVATLDVRGSSGTTLRIQEGNQGAGKVLTSDADGDATWTTAPTQTVTITAGTGISVAGSVNTFTITNTGGVSSPSVTITDDNATNATMYPVWVTANSGDLPLKVSSLWLSFNPGTQRLGVKISAPVSTLHVADKGTFGLSTFLDGSLDFMNSSNVNIATIKTGVTAASYTMTLPTAQGAASTFLQNDGAGVLSWAAPATQTVTITAGDGISVAGSINTFTITNTSPSSTAWQLAGNTLTGSLPASPTEFIGTNNAADWIIKTNTVERMRIGSTGLVGIGTGTSTTKFVNILTSLSGSAAANHGVSLDHTWTGTGGVAAVISGMAITAHNQSITSANSTLIASNLISSSESGVNTLNVIGVQIQTKTTAAQTGLVAEADGIRILTPTYAGTKPSQQYGVKILNQWVTGMSNSAGVYINAQTVTTPPTSFGIISESGNLNGFGATTPSAYLHLGSGIATADRGAPLKFDSGTNLTVAETGAVEYDGTNLYFTPTGTNRYKVGMVLTGSATLDFANLAAIGCEDLTITVTGAVDGDDVVVSPPNGSVVANSAYSAWVSAANTVSVRFCTFISGNPASGTFKVTVIKN